MLIQDSDRGMGFLLTDAARLLRKLIDRRLQPLALTRAQWSILAILRNRDGQSQSQIAEELEIEKATAGRLIDHLERSGRVERRPISGDRRAWGVYLTGQAGPLIVEVERILLDTRSDMLRGLAPLQQEQLAEAMRAVKLNLSRAIDADRLEHDLPEPEDTDA
jgi:MarR family transcriptional regulator for hemolysin